MLNTKILYIDVEAVNMRGLVVMPLNYQKGKQYPLSVDIHGGDMGASIYLLGGTLLSSPLEWQLWAALLILFVDFSYMSLEFRKLKSHIQGEKSYTPNSFTNMIVTIQWLMGVVAIVFTIIGGVFGILSVSN